MNHESVIDWHLSRLESGESTTMSNDMQSYVDEHPDLKQELATLHQFWQPQPELPQPTAALKQGFNASVAQWQMHNQIQSSTQSNLHHRWWLQAAVLALVFVSGIGLGRLPFSNDTETKLVSLQQDVGRLNTVMAISMLQQSSASQRLTGVNYARQTDLVDPMLLDTLLGLLKEEKSTAVKLSVIDTLKAKTGFESMVQPLITAAINEQQPLVQIALCQLLFERAGYAEKQSLVSQLRQQDLNPDVSAFLDLMDAQQRI